MKEVLSLSLSSYGQEKEEGAQEEEKDDEEAPKVIVVKAKGVVSLKRDAAPFHVIAHKLSDRPRQ